MIAVFRFGNYQACHECTQCNGESYAGGQPHNCEAYHKDAQQEEFLAPRPGDLIQCLWHNPFSTNDDQQKDTESLDQEKNQGFARIPCCPSQ